MWGVGAWIGPYIMGYALTSGGGWNAGYRYVAILQGLLVIGLLLSQPLWRGHTKESGAERSEKVLSLSEIIRISGAKEIMITFFCYCAIEMTTGLWGSSYLNLHNGVTLHEAARFAGLFYLGITVGRAISGFITMHMSDEGMVRLGGGVMLVGIIGLLLPTNLGLAQAGLVLIGLGCAPVYPCIIHSTPAHFGADRSQAIIGVQMASAYVGTCLVPPLFGLIAQYINISLFPIFLFIILIIMMFMHEQMIAKTKKL
jgi:fucose permease